MISFNVVTITLAAGLAYVLMAMTVWSLLRRTPHRRVVRVWTLGAALGGAAMMLIASRGLVPDMVGYAMPSMLLGASALLLVGALRLHCQLPSRVGLMGLLWLLASAVHIGLVLAGRLPMQVAASCLMLALGASAVARYARLTARRERSRGAMLVFWGHAALVVALLVRAASVLSEAAPQLHPVGGLDYALLHATAALAALYGNLGFVGLVMDITRRAEATAREAQVAEAARREAAEQAALSLRGLLQQRDSLAGEREHLLQVLAHEIRQPLHNASGALQAAGQALRAPLATDVDLVAQRLGRAEAVLGHVRSVLDNTLAAATLLGRSAPLALQEVALDFLVELALGDLEEAHRARVQLRWCTDQRHAECEPGLVRLALRNLLVNAFDHGGAAVAVVLEVAEQADPPALLVSVIDDGVGASATRLTPSEVPLATAERGDASGGVMPARGLGLRIVRQVMALHGGSLVLAGVAPHGLRACLVLPLPEA